MRIQIDGVRPYDGSYELDWDDELTTREWGWVKRLSGYLPLDLERAADDPEFACVLAVIAMRRAGKIDTAELLTVFERLIDAPFVAAITLEFDAADEPEEPEADDAGPPASSSNGSETSSGAASPPSSEPSEAETLHGIGTPASASSESGPPTWES